MKPEITNEAELRAWILDPVPAVFQKLDLHSKSSEIAKMPLIGCAFIGCAAPFELVSLAAAQGCVILPPVPESAEVPFDPYTVGLYSPAELYNGYDPSRPETADVYFDRRVYLSYMNKDKQLIPSSADVMLLRRMHDATVATALDRLVSGSAKRIVAVMGGHDRVRGEAIYTDVARLGLQLTQAGYMVATGGGPGLMEAANFGAYCAGFADPQKTLSKALSELSDSVFDPKKPDWASWLARGVSVWTSMGSPADSSKCRSLGIPTWFYGHEPPNVFATDIAKYFENSVREEGLLAIAQGGIIFAEGNGGTVQEIFQDACQNYYRTYAKSKSPMVLLGKSYWNPDEMVFTNPSDKRKKVYPLLLKLATEKNFDDFLCITDSIDEAIAFILAHPPAIA